MDTLSNNKEFTIRKATVDDAWDILDFLDYMLDGENQQTLLEPSGFWTVVNAGTLPPMIINNRWRYFLLLNSHEMVCGLSIINIDSDAKVLHLVPNMVDTTIGIRLSDVADVAAASRLQ